LIGVTFVLFVVTANPFKVSLPTLPAATGVVPEANAAGVPKVSFAVDDLTHYVYRS
jgi:hypothetical protein